MKTCANRGSTGHWNWGAKLNGLAMLLSIWPALPWWPTRSITDSPWGLSPLQRIHLHFQHSICTVLHTQWLERTWQNVDRIYPLGSHVEKRGTTIWLYIHQYKCKWPLWNWNASLWHCMGTCFFSFPYRGAHYPCVVICWFNKIGDEPDEDMGMWKVRLSILPNHWLHFAVIHIDTIYRAAHLIPIYGNRTISRDVRPHHSYDVFCACYVNKYADHHAFEIVG